MVVAAFHGTIAPSPSESAGSGTTRSGSISMRYPSPWHASHAPNGIVERKHARDEIVDADMAVRAGKPFGKNRPAPLCHRSMSTVPFALILSAVSSDSVSRGRMPGRRPGGRPPPRPNVFCFCQVLISSVERTDVAVEAHPDIAVFLQFVKQVAVLPLAARYDRRKYLESRACAEAS